MVACKKRLGSHVAKMLTTLSAATEHSPMKATNARRQFWTDDVKWLPLTANIPARRGKAGCISGGWEVIPDIAATLEGHHFCLLYWDLLYPGWKKPKASYSHLFPLHTLPGSNCRSISWSCTCNYIILKKSISTHLVGHILIFFKYPF